LRSAFLVLAFAAILLPARAAHAWAHQGHILLTRLACLRIINDPAAPEDLKAFLKANMKYDLESCRRLATEELVGAEARNHLVGMDGAATLPDRIIDTDEGKTILEPFGVPEAKLHFIDLEYFTADPTYADDLSHKPKFTDVPRDVKDPRFKNSGFLPLRAADVYQRLVTALGTADKPLDNTAAVKWAGYLAHYLEDSTQPHHGTADFKSLSYLVGKVKGVESKTSKHADGTQTAYLSVDRKLNINPHGDLEFQLFENTEEPHKTLRVEYWDELQRELKRLDAEPAAKEPAKFDAFAVSLTLVLQGYDHLPVVGHAAQAAYETGKFDPAAFFKFQGKGPAGEETIIQLIARQNAAAVRAVEQGLRAAWDEAKKK